MHQYRIWVMFSELLEDQPLEISMDQEHMLRTVSRSFLSIFAVAIARVIWTHAGSIAVLFTSISTSIYQRRDTLINFCFECCTFSDIQEICNRALS